MCHPPQKQNLEEPREGSQAPTNPARTSWSDTFTLDTPSLASSSVCTGSGFRERQSQQRTLESMEPGRPART